MIGNVNNNVTLSMWNTEGAERLQQIQAQVDLETSRLQGVGKSLMDAMLALDEPLASGDTIALMLQEIRAKLGDNSLKSAAEGIKATGDAKEVAHQERMDKLKEAAEAAEEAKKSGVLGKVFGWIGAALAVIAAVAVAIATFGAAAPASAAAIAGVIGAMTGAVLAMTTQIVTSIPSAMEAMGPEGAQAFMWTMMALQIAAAALSLGAGLASTSSTVTAAGKAGQAVADASDDLARLVTSGADDAAIAAAQETLKQATLKFAETSEKLAQQGTKIARLGTQLGNYTRVAEGVNMVGQGANQIVGAQHQHDADMARADAAEFRKLLIQLQAIEESETEFVEKIVTMLDEAAGIVSQIASDTSRATATIVRNA